MATKQLRYLENADLHIDLIKIYPKNYGLLGQPQLPDLKKTIDSLTHKVSIEKLNQAMTKELPDVINELDEQHRSGGQIVYEAIEASNFIGVSEEDLMVCFPIIKII